MPKATETTTKKINQFFASIGRRKSASAQVRLTPGKGKITLNHEEVDSLDQDALMPLVLADQLGKFDISIVVRGGGMTGQKDAIKLGIARALIEYNEEFRSTMRKAGFTTRDPREKERKKPGLKRARKAPQWSKR